MAGPFDATVKDLLDAFAADWVSWIAPRIGLPANVSVEAVDADLSTVTAEADKVFRLRPPAEGHLHLELQASWDGSLPDRTLLYNVLIEHRLGGPVYSVVILLRPAAKAVALTGQVQRRKATGEAYLDFRYEVICLWEVPSERLLAAGIGAAPLALLTDDAAPRLPELVSKFAERLREQQTVPAVAETLWTACYILLGLRYDKIMIDQLLSNVQGLEESTTYQAIINKGKQVGLQQGKQEGLQQGLQEALLSLLAERFQTVPADLEQRIKGCDDAERLKMALRRAVHIDTLTDFAV